MDHKERSLIVTSANRDPFWNLAAEDFLLDKLPGGQRILFLWRGRTSVVIGRHQNPWRECNLAALQAGGGVLARRLSGGGAVYHDEGNLNYALFCRRDAYDPAFAPALVTGALDALGLRVRPMGKSSLAVRGHKFSGTAYCYRRETVLHHGTLLVNAHLEKMIRFLAAPPLQVKTHAVASEPAPVANLTRWSAGLTPLKLAEVLKREFARRVEGVIEATHPMDVGGDEWQARVERLRRWEWRFGHTPAFEAEWVLPDASGRVRVRVRNGRVESVEPSMPGGAHTWVGRRFDPALLPAR